jgi:predicted MPP superfamily phosphohydrolase
MKNRLPILLSLLLLTACDDRYAFVMESASSKSNSSDHIKIAVVSDIHYMDPTLLANGASTGQAFLDYLNADPKLIEYSDAITRQMIAEVMDLKPQIMLIPGDLTKDGERISHTSLTTMLQELRARGIKVFVVPGNHDINNPEAVAYSGDFATPTPTVSATEFASLYNDFGYGSAIYRDPHSLSYVSAPYNDLWILAIDDAKYADNSDIAIISGSIKPETHQWVLERLAEARQNNIRVLGLMHHNLIEHYPSQTLLDPGYVTDDYEMHVNAFMDAGLQVIFTGHYHANDVTSRTYNGRILHDVETGSQVSPPVPYRVVTLKNKQLEIESQHITSINMPMPGELDFVTYSNMFFAAHLDGIFSYLLTRPPFDLSEADAAAAAPQFRNAYMAHFAGDERISPAEQSLNEAIASMSPMAGMALAALWTDLNTKDNKLHISLK